MQAAPLHPIEALHQQLEGRTAWIAADRLGPGHQGRGLGQGQFFPGRRQGLGRGLELLLEGADPLDDLARLGLETVAQGLHHQLPLLQVGEHGRSGHGLNAADAGGHARFGHDLEQADLGRVGHVGAAAKLHRHAGHIHHPHHVGVLLAEHRHGAGRLGLLDRHLLHL